MGRINFFFSFSETASEQSDLESRIAALHEELKKRKLEAERLRREQKKAQRERLKVKEQSLLMQIQAYDAYIQKKKKELEQEYEGPCKTVTKPLIKQPKFSDKTNLKRPDSLLLGENDKMKFYPRLCGKGKEKDEKIITFGKVTESDSEIIEQIKESSSESIKEDVAKTLTESVRECSEVADGESKSESSIREIISPNELKYSESFIEEGGSSLNEISETGISGSSSPELPPPPDDVDVDEESQTESEDQSTSIKTTLQSPEKPTTETMTESKEKTDTIQIDAKMEEDEKEEEEENEVKEEEEGEIEMEEEEEEKTKTMDIINDNTYQSDTFESDFDEKSSAKVTSVQKETEPSEIETFITDEKTQSSPQSKEDGDDDVDKESSKTSSREIIEEEEKKTENENIERLDLTDSVCNLEDKPPLESQRTVESLGDIKTDISDDLSEGKKKKDVNEIISESIIGDSLYESVSLFSKKKQKAKDEKEKSEKLKLQTIINGYARDFVNDAIDHVFNIYDGKKCDVINGEDEPISPEKINFEIRKKICDAIRAGREGGDENATNAPTLTTTSPVKNGKPEIQERKKFLENNRETIFFFLTQNFPLQMKKLLMFTSSKTVRNPIKIRWKKKTSRTKR